MTTKKSVNAVVAKKLDEDYVLHSISWVAGNDCGPFAGKQLTGGCPEIVRGVKVVVFKEKHKGHQAQVRYENRPGLAALVAEYKTIQKEEEEKREAEMKKREEKYLATADLRRCLVAFRDEYFRVEYSVETLEYNKDDNRFFQAQYNANYKELKHVTPMMDKIMKRKNYREYGLGGAAWEISPKQEEKILAEHEATVKEAEAAAKTEVERKDKERVERKIQEKAELEKAFEDELFIFGDEYLSSVGNRLLHSLGAKISQKDNRIEIYTTGYSRMIPNAVTTYTIKDELKATGFQWDGENKIWHAEYNEETANKTIDLLKKHDTKVDPHALGLARCWECGRWCKPSELDESGYCGC